MAEDSFMSEFYLHRSIAKNESMSDDLGMYESIIKLDDAEFQDKAEFAIFSRQTIQTYKESNKELHKLILKMKISDDDCSSLATELIMDALNLSVKKLRIKSAYRGKKVVLPGQVFESTSLKELSVTHCVINQPISSGTVPLPLVSLQLKCFSMEDDMMTDILSRCPSIEFLDLFESNGLTKISLGKMHINLKHFTVEHTDGVCVVDFFEKGFTRFPNLNSLLLNDLNIEETFFCDSMLKFPCLTELSLNNVFGFEERLEISIPSLKLLNVAGLTETRSVFNVPNIHKFKYFGFRDIPSLLITTSSEEWECSDIVVECYDVHISQPWFLRLREFVQNLSVSKNISLRLKFEYSREDQICIDKLIEEGDSGAPCIHVENLVFVGLLGQDNLSLLAFSKLVSGLFSTCRPNLITLIEYPKRQPSERDLAILEFLRKSVTEQTNWKCDLKQVAFEMLFEEETVKEWRPILWEELVSSLGLNYSIQIRLKLR